MTKSTTFDAREELSWLKQQLVDDYCTDLGAYDCYICDAVSEIADDSVSIYTADLVECALENDDDVDEALSTGLAMSGADYFAANPRSSFRDYAAHVGAAAWYLATERRIYDVLEDAVEYAVLERLKDAHGSILNAEAWERVKSDHSISWDDNNEELSDIYEEAERLYAGDEAEEE